MRLGSLFNNADVHGCMFFNDHDRVGVDDAQGQQGTWDATITESVPRQHRVSKTDSATSTRQHLGIGNCAIFAYFAEPETETRRTRVTICGSYAIGHFLPRTLFSDEPEKPHSPRESNGYNPTTLDGARESNHKKCVVSLFWET